MRGITFILSDPHLCGLVVGDEVIRLGHSVNDPSPAQAGPVAVQLDRVPVRQPMTRKVSQLGPSFISK